MASIRDSGGDRAAFPNEFDDLDALEDALDDEISRLVDDELAHAETMADTRIEHADEETLEVHIEENTTAEWLPPTSGSWGTRAYERWHDVVVQAIENIGRFHYRRNEEDRPDRDGHLVFQVPLEDNRGELAAIGGS